MRRLLVLAVALLLAGCTGDAELFSRPSMNFTLGLYDSDTGRLYYLEYDT